MLNSSGVALILLILTPICLSLPARDEERYYDKEYAKNLIDWLSSEIEPSYKNPCPSGGNTIRELYRNNNIKRNSELINSLLGIPKNMDEAGK